MIQISYECRARGAIDDLLGRTAHVHVDDVRALRFSNPYSFSHPFRLAASKLDDVNSDPLSVAANGRLAFATHEAGAGGHFGYHQAGTQLLRKPAERSVRNPRHRSQNHAVRHLDRPDSQWGAQYSPRFWTI